MKPIVVIPMSGAGSRFANAGYSFPKPLIPIYQKPMIQVVVENLDIEGDYIFIVRKEHYEKYHLNSVLNLIKPGCTIIQVEGLTEGAACTTLLAKDYINVDRPLIIANSDQFLEWDSDFFMRILIENGEKGLSSGRIVTFQSTHPKWSFCAIREDYSIERVVEKEPISDIATAGIYAWNKGSDYVKYAEQMIAKNIRVNNEFYCAPVFNEAIADGHRFYPHDIQRMWGIGIPEDLNFFLNHYKGDL